MTTSTIPSLISGILDALEYIITETVTVVIQIIPRLIRMVIEIAQQISSTLIEEVSAIFPYPSHTVASVFIFLLSVVYFYTRDFVVVIILSVPFYYLLALVRQI